MSNRNSQPKQSQPEPKKDGPVMAMIVNSDSRLRSVTWYESTNNERPRIKAVQFLPGLNLIEPGKLAACDFDRVLEKRPEVSAHLRPVNPVDMMTHSAVELAKNTSSRPALKAWLALEKRPEVKNAIEQNLRGELTPEDSEEV